MAKEGAYGVYRIDAKHLKGYDPKTVLYARALERSPHANVYHRTGRLKASR